MPFSESKCIFFAKRGKYSQGSELAWGQQNSSNEKKDILVKWGSPIFLRITHQFSIQFSNMKHWLYEPEYFVWAWNVVKVVFPRPITISNDLFHTNAIVDDYNGANFAHKPVYDSYSTKMDWTTVILKTGAEIISRSMIVLKIILLWAKLALTPIQTKYWSPMCSVQIRSTGEECWTFRIN